MYPVGVVILLQSLLEHELPSAFILVTLSLLLSVLFLCRNNERHQDAPVTLPRFFPLNIVPFFRRRHDFLAWGFRVTDQRLFQFRLLRNNVVVISGEQGRKDFFNAKGLDLQEGFRVLSGALPLIHGVTTELRQQRVARIYKRLMNVQRNERLTELIPEILDDGRRLLRPWEKAGSLDPFDKIYELTFQTTVRCLTCTEIASDPEVVARLRQLYDKLDRGTTPATVLFPWFPSPAMVSKARATKQIYDIIVNAIKVRKQSGVTHGDTLQNFLDSGDDESIIIGFMMGLVTAGARSTGTTASWLITFLGCHPKWRNEVRSEVKNLIMMHALETISELNSPRYPTSTALSSIPLTVWENETPVLDMLIRETLRIAQPHVAMRRNIGPKTYIDGKAIPSGAFAIYSFANVHLDPALYPDPWKFDPTRSQLKDNFSYLGWGAGRVSCLGARLARLNIKLLTALLLLEFEFDTVDASGRIADPHPIPNWNDALMCRPAQANFSSSMRRWTPRTDHEGLVRW
ncbi:cytochrome P450 [Multifurca ochricompacta]|uniref:Cytochrome P450 n=1 Tax=Multifurca ochricompacta TaxID=376703 RepID=A0AAD4QMF6_9AGAM|nr:cytochrome P450 [Multifurca ochricompacta]